MKKAGKAGNTLTSIFWTPQVRKYPRNLYPTTSLKVPMSELAFSSTTCSTLIHNNNNNNNVCPNKSNNRILRGQTPQTLPQCLLHQLRNGLQPLPAPSNHHKSPPQSPSLDILGRTDMHRRQWGGERLLPARRERERDRGALPGHEPTYYHPSFPVSKTTSDATIL